MNIKEFSALAGVSTATVSRVFARNSSVAGKTRERILELAQRHGFRPNQVAKASFGGKTKSVGVLLCRLTNSYFANIAIGVQKVMLAEDYLPIIIDLREDGTRAGIKRLVDHRVDGIIVSISDRSLTPTEIGEIVRFKLPVVTVDGNWLDGAYDNVCSDDYRGGYLAGKFLVENGHRNIVFCGHTISSATAYRRVEGFRDALSEGGVPFSKNNIIEIQSSAVNQVITDLKLAHRLKKSDFTAAYCYNDDDALTLYRIVQSVGMTVPEDFSIIGHADLDFATVMSPALTTIRQDGIAIGKRAATMMLDRLKSVDCGPRLESQNVELIVRESVANIKTEK